MVKDKLWLQKFKWSLFFSYPKHDYYAYLKNKSISEIIDDKFKYEHEQSLAKEFKNLVTGSYSLIVGTIVSFGIFLIRQPLSKGSTKQDLATAFINASLTAFKFALFVAIVLALLQYIAYRFEMIGKQRIDVINQYIEYRVNDKNGNNKDTVFGCVINDLKNKKILQLVEEKLKKAGQDEKKKENSKKKKQNTKKKQDAAQKPKQTTGEQDTAQKLKQNTEKKQDDSRKSKQGTEEEQANNPKLNSSGEKVQDDNDQGSNQDEQKKTREK